MNLQENKLWDDWCNAHIKRALDTRLTALTKLMVDKVTTTMQAQLETAGQVLKAQNEKHEAEIRDLRSEIAVLKGNVTPIRGRDAA